LPQSAPPMSSSPGSLAPPSSGRDDRPEPRDPKGVRLAVALLLLIHAGLLAWIGARNSPTLDEVAHLPSGLSHWQFGNFDLYNVNPPLVRMLAAVPLLVTDPKTDWSPFDSGPFARSEFAVGRSFVEVNGPESFWYFTLARWACIPLSLLGGYFCWRWGRELFGVSAGLMALTLWCFSPNILGNAAMITPDAGGAALGVMAGYFFWRWLHQCDWPAALAAGISLGFAELTKSTWLILFGLWPLVWLLYHLSGERRLSLREWRMQFGQLSFVLLLGVYLINLGYGFEGSFTKLGDYVFVSRALNGKEEDRQTGNRFSKHWLASVPVPFPQNYIRGIDIQRSDFERKKWSFLRGEHRFGGWWYWYLYAIGVKVPVGFLLCGLLATGAAISHWRNPHRWREDFVVLAPGLAVLILVSSQTGFNRYLRYVLPAFPVAFVWMSQVAPAALRRRTTTVLVGALLAWAVASSLWVFPHNLSYFNELAGGPLGGPRHLLDANIDWGQDLRTLQRWLEANPQARPLHLKYFGFVEPRSVGIEYEAVPRGPLENAVTQNGEESGPRPGWYAISANYLYGYKHYEHDEPHYTYFQRFTPVARAGYSIFIYHITPEAANRVRHEMGLPPLNP